MKYVIEIDLEESPLRDDSPETVASLLHELAEDITHANLPEPRSMKQGAALYNGFLVEWTNNEETKVFVRARVVNEAFDSKKADVQPKHVQLAYPDGRREDITDEYRQH